MTEGQTIDNKEYVYAFMVEELAKSFPTLSKNQTSQYIAQLFNSSSNVGQFKVHSFYDSELITLDSFERLFDQIISV